MNGAGNVAISPAQLIDRLVEGIARDIFYVVGEDSSGGIDFPVSDLRMKADAILYGLPPVRWYRTPESLKEGVRNTRKNTRDEWYQASAEGKGFQPMELGEPVGLPKHRRSRM